MVTDHLEATASTAEQLSLVHSLLQLEDDTTFKDAAQWVADELSLSRGYVELLIEVLVEKGQFEFVMSGPSAGKICCMLHFTGDAFLDLDQMDLDRLNLADVSQRLTDRLKTLGIEIDAANAEIRDQKQRSNQLAQAEVAFNSANSAVKRARQSVARAEGVLASKQASLSGAEARLIEATERRDRLRAELSE